MPGVAGRGGRTGKAQKYFTKGEHQNYLFYIRPQSTQVLTFLLSLFLCNSSFASILNFLALPSCKWANLWFQLNPTLYFYTQAEKVARGNSKTKLMVLILNSLWLNWSEPLSASQWASYISVVDLLSSPNNYFWPFSSSQSQAKLLAFLPISQSLETFSGSHGGVPSEFFLKKNLSGSCEEWSEQTACS